MTINNDGPCSQHFSTAKSYDIPDDFEQFIQQMNKNGIKIICNTKYIRNIHVYRSQNNDEIVCEFYD